MESIDGLAGNICNTGTWNAARNEERRRKKGPIKSPAYEVLGLILSIMVKSGHQDFQMYTRFG